VVLALTCHLLYLFVVICGMVLPEQNEVYDAVDSISFLLLLVNNVANPVIFGWKDKLIQKLVKKQLLAMKFNRNIPGSN